MSRTSTKALSAIVLVAAVTSLGGCKALIRKLAQKNDPTTTTTSTAGPKPTTTTKITQDDPETALIKKVDPLVVKCLNAFSSRVRDSERRYYSWVDYKTGVTGKERLVYGVYEVSGNTNDCAQAVAKSNALSPKNPALEQAALEYNSALAQIVPLLSEANKYYDRDKYKDDKLAKGKEMHPRLKEGFDRFIKADNALAEEVDKLQDVIDKAKLAKYEKNYGHQSYPYLIRSTLIYGKVVVREGDRAFDKIDVTKYEPKVVKLEEAADELEKLMTKKGDSASTWTSLYQYMQAHQTLVKAAKEQVRRSKDKRPFSNMERDHLARGGPVAQSVEGSSSKMVKAFNDMIDRYNSLQKEDKYHKLFTQPQTTPGATNNSTDDDEGN
ncbi:MAG: YiiG family protein [Myxococcales bacterium]|jgi:hypothetical protein|nr:YiiG family protein [Myxococcales bacterium]